MSLHDAYPRRTPYERFLPDPGFPGRHFAAIADEAERRAVGLGDPGVFAVLESAAEALDELRDPAEGAESLGRHAVMLFHAWHHHAAATPVVLLTTAAVRRVTAEPWSPDPSFPPPGASLYLQFPRHLVWVRPDAEAPPLSLDGVYRTASGDGLIHHLAVGGVSGGGAGFTALPVPGAPVEHESGWTGIRARDDGADFASSLPGADLDRLVEIRTAGEILKLVARAVRHMGAAEPAQAGDGAADPPPSRLPARRLDLESPDHA